MDEDQKRAFDFVVGLRNFHADYGLKKEREAYVTAVLYLGATVAALTTTKKFPIWLLLVGLGVGTVVVVLLVGWQLWNRNVAARLVATCMTVTSRWLAGGAPTAHAVASVEGGPLGIEWPRAVAGQYAQTPKGHTRVIFWALPPILFGWGVGVIAVLWRGFCRAG